MVGFINLRFWAVLSYVLSYRRPILIYNHKFRLVNTTILPISQNCPTENIIPFKSSISSLLCSSIIYKAILRFPMQSIFLSNCQFNRVFRTFLICPFLIQFYILIFWQVGPLFKIDNFDVYMDFLVLNFATPSNYAQ